MASINLTWSASVPAPASGYRIKYWPTTQPNNVTTVVPNVSGTSYTINNLTGSSYTGTIEASCGAGTFSSPVSWSATATVQTYYYYTGILCGGGITTSFRSTQNNLADQGVIVKALYNGQEQCFDTVTPITTPTTNDVIGTFPSCAACTGAGSNCDCYAVSVSAGATVQVGYYDCSTNQYTYAQFSQGDTVSTYVGTTPMIVGGSGSLNGPYACLN